VPDTNPYHLQDTSELLSPGLLVFRSLVRDNIKKLIEIARAADRLRPHVKTHKMAEIIRELESFGIHKHKCATIAEAEMVAAAGGTDLLVSYPLVGPNLKRFAQLARGYRATTFRATVDNVASAQQLSEAVAGVGRPIPVLVDLEIGMGRTGIQPGEAAAELYAQLAQLPGLTPDGLHAYDGHIHDTDLDARRHSTSPGFEQVLALRTLLLERGLPVPRIVAGGTPTFPLHAELDIPGLEFSPGTLVFEDASYLNRYPDLAFTPAALLITRVISHPRPDRLCLDLGYKAVAADQPLPRARLLGLEDAKHVMHSEEHLVVETPHAGDYPVGTPILAIPTHVCPTVALHKRAYIIENGQLTAQWDVTARDRLLGN
jgi:D-serine deaminase-like pyridoxal phosphate-dependent protein